MFLLDGEGKRAIVVRRPCSSASKRDNMLDYKLRREVRFPPVLGMCTRARLARSEPHAKTRP